MKESLIRLFFYNYCYKEISVYAYTQLEIRNECKKLLDDLDNVTKY